MLKKISAWVKHAVRHSNFRINDRYYRLSIVFNEAGLPLNFAFFIFNDHRLSLASAKNPSRWMFYFYFFGRRLCLPMRKLTPLSN